MVKNKQRSDNLQTEQTRKKNRKLETKGQGQSHIVNKAHQETLNDWSGV